MQLAAVIGGGGQFVCHTRPNRPNRPNKHTAKPPNRAQGRSLAQPRLPSPVTSHACLACHLPRCCLLFLYLTLAHLPSPVVCASFAIVIVITHSLCCAVRDCAALFSSPDGSTIAIAIAIYLISAQAPDRHYRPPPLLRIIAPHRNPPQIARKH